MFDMREHKKLLDAIAVSPKPYNNWLDRKRIMKPEQDIEQTRVPELRKRLLLLAAKSNYKAFAHYVRVALHATVRHAHDVVESIVETERKERFELKSLQDAFSVARLEVAQQLQGFSQSGLLSKIGPVTKRNMTAPVHDRIQEIMHVIETTSKGLPYQTHSKMLRRGGILTPRESMHPSLRGRHQLERKLLPNFP